MHQLVLEDAINLSQMGRSIFLVHSFVICAETHSRDQNIYQ